MTVTIVVWGAAMAWSSARLVLEYRRDPPPGPLRQLADDLSARGQAHVWASYWVSYHVNVLSLERVHLSPTSAIRITDYARRAHRAGPTGVVVTDDPCDGGRAVPDWYLCPGE